jgi:hypothetical protein
MERQAYDYSNLVIRRGGWAVWSVRRRYILAVVTMLFLYLAENSQRHGPEVPIEYGIPLSMLAISTSTSSGSGFVDCLPVCAHNNIDYWPTYIPHSQKVRRQ